MQVTTKKLSSVSSELTVSLNEADLSESKRAVFNELRPKVKAAGFRPGKSPDNIVERELGQPVVQSEVIDAAINRHFSLALVEAKLSIIGQPEIKLQKFVPYSELEFSAVCEVMPEIKLPDYKKFKIAVKAEEPTAAKVGEVLERMQKRLAEKKPVERAAKEGDEVWIDFKGTDAQGHPVKGASGEDFPVIIGSNTFIPGFEPALVGVKPGGKKTFDVTFPKEYHSVSLRGAKVKFEVEVKKVNELDLPKLDDDFAAKSSPFKTMKELRADVSRQLEQELNEQAEKQRRQEVVKQLVDKSKLEIPPKLTANVLKEIKAEFKRSLDERGLDEEEFYKSQNTTADKYEKTELQAAAERRVKASLTLSEVASREKLSISRDELDAHIEALRQRYSDNPEIQAELDKPTVREDIAMQALTERTIDKLLENSVN